MNEIPTWLADAFIAAATFTFICLGIAMVILVWKDR